MKLANLIKEEANNYDLQNVETDLKEFYDLLIKFLECNPPGKKSADDIEKYYRTPNANMNIVGSFLAIKNNWPGIREDLLEIAADIRKVRNFIKNQKKI